MKSGQAHFPIGFTSAGVPIGTILGGLPYGEERLLSVVAAYQEVTDWHWRRPANPPAAPDARTARGTLPAPEPDESRGRLTAEQVAELTQ